MEYKELQTLRLARLTIENPESWTQYGYAYDASGLRVDYNSSLAAQWCVIGAVRLSAQVLYPKSSHDVAWNAQRTLNDYIAARSLYAGVIGWQDNPNRTHDEVLQMLDDVIGQSEHRLESR